MDTGKTITSEGLELAADDESVYKPGLYAKPSQFRVTHRDGEPSVFDVEVVSFDGQNLSLSNFPAKAGFWLLTQIKAENVVHVSLQAHGFDFSLSEKLDVAVSGVYADHCYITLSPRHE